MRSESCIGGVAWPDEWSSAGAVSVRGAVEYVVRVGDGPEDEWRVSVAEPPSSLRAVSGEGPWPALYLVDAPITFVVAAQVAQTTLAFSLGQLRPVAVVGIGPASGELADMLTRRNRDLTPTTAVPGHLAGSTPSGAGGAGAMLDLIEQRIAPGVEARHRLDPADRGLGGISLGGLFTCWALASRPRAFRRYLAVSPSLYWDDHLLLDERRTPLEGLRGIEHDTGVYLAVGEHEEAPQNGWPVPSAEMLAAMEGIRMVSEARAFAGRLAGAGVDVHADVIAGENHATVWPAAVTRGLVALYGRSDGRSVP